MTDDFKMIHVHKFNDVQKQSWDGNDEPYRLCAWFTIGLLW